MIVERDLGVDVLTAARRRVCNIFGNGLPVYLAFSGGKDSLALADITVKLAEAGLIDISQLRVEFIDEEAIFPCVDQVVRQWREKFILMGARFDWYCLEVRHYNCLNQLENDESFICWDSTKRDCWIREPPPFAIRSHPNLPPPYFAKTKWHGARHDNYQEFLLTVCDGIRMTGLRVFESIQRRIAIANQKPIDDLAKRPTFEPIYDWRDADVWRYLAENDIAIPDAYLHLYQIGTPIRGLRISQFFSVDTAHNLARIAEFYPNLMERILRREPAAYIVSLYWDSEMFRRRSRARREIEEKSEAVDWKARVLKMFEDIDGNFQSTAQRALARDFHKLLLQRPYLRDKHYRDIHDALIAGDPKRRSFRAIVTNCESDAAHEFVTGHAAFVVSSGSRRAPGRARPAETEPLQPEHGVAG
jgi:predicted phosphoadenosine phosphosulfate sulfurtransferase